MKILHTSNQIPDWQIERAKKLHRACLSLQAAMQSGEPKAKALRRVGGSFSGRRFKSDPSRRMSLCAGSLRRLFKVWKAGGEVPAAFYIQYKGGLSQVSATVLIRFVEFCASARHESMKSAWLKFCARFGHGRRSSKPPQVSLGQVYYFFPASQFYQLQEQLNIVHNAQVNLGGLRLQLAEYIQARLTVGPSLTKPLPKSRFPAGFPPAADRAGQVATVPTHEASGLSAQSPIRGAGAINGPLKDFGLRSQDALGNPFSTS